jgi:uncharacterized protein YidB (DUF937 family)
MSLFNDVVSKLTGGATSGESGQGVGGAVLELLNNQKGGISGLLEKFQQGGLGDLMSSWIGTGTNLPISSEQIQQVLGQEQIQAFAQKAGIAPEAASSQLAEALPDVVDKLTPDGQAPQGDDLMSRGMAMLQGLMSKAKSTS